MNQRTEESKEKRKLLGRNDRAQCAQDSARSHRWFPPFSHASDKSNSACENLAWLTEMLDCYQTYLNNVRGQVRVLAGDERRWRGGRPDRRAQWLLCVCCDFFFVSSLFCLSFLLLSFRSVSLPSPLLLFLLLFLCLPLCFLLYFPLCIFLSF